MAVAVGEYRLCRCGFPPVRGKKIQRTQNGYLHHLLRLHCGQRGSDACRHFRRKCHASPHPHPADVFADAKLYLHIYIYGFLFLYLYNICNGIFTSLGDSRTPLYFLIGSSISNILLDIFFVVWLKMGVAGVAWATFAAQGAASVLAFLTLLHRIKQLRSTEPYAKFSAEMLVQVTIVAIPSILQQCFVSIGNLFVQSAVNSYGSAVVAGFSACQKLNTFAVTCMTTLSNGVSSFTAQNLGADKKERISEGFRAGTLLGILVCVPFFLFYFFFGRTAMGLFLDESSAAAIQAGVDYMHIVTPFYFIVTIKVMCDGCCAVAVPCSIS